jgi:hypothetical protein
MADDQEVRVVRIRRKPNGQRGCIVEPPFRVKKGRTVTFVPINLPPITITFRNGSSPFANNPVPAGEHTVVNGPGSFEFEVTWDEPDGPDSGNGTGDVPPA